MRFNGVMSQQQKNLLVIISDQLSFRALNLYDNSAVKTPILDKFFADGFVFDNAYAACPLCLPARSAMWSGHFPHQTGAMSNAGLLENPDLSEAIPSLGEYLGKAGYNCIHIGKEHDAGALRGFERMPGGSNDEEKDETWGYNMDTFRDVHTTMQACDRLSTIGSDPFAVIVDFQNPHNICGFTSHNNELPDGVIKDLPELLPNFDCDDFESRPLPVQYLCCEHNRQQQSCGWSKEKWQRYVAAYYHYITYVDQQIGDVLAALEASGQAENTIVCFSADHGDNMGSRRMATKHCSFYEETTHIPLMFAGPGIPKGRSDALVSHLDFLPTFCSLLGVDTDEQLWGKKLADIMCNNAAGHDFVISEWYSEWGTTIEPCRMLRGPKWKYTSYREENAEELYDLENDPYELKNLAPLAEYADTLAEQREIFKQHVADTNDDFFNMEWKADKRWRSHKPGYHHHEGPTAPQVMLKK